MLDEPRPELLEGLPEKLDIHVTIQFLTSARLISVMLVGMVLKEPYQARIYMRAATLTDDGRIKLRLDIPPAGYEPPSIPWLF